MKKAGFWLWAVIGLASLVILVPFGLWLLLTIDIPCDPHRIVQLEVGADRTISIYEECGWRELSALIYYDVHVGNARVVPISEVRYYDLSDIDQLTFEVIDADAGNLIGVLETSVEPQLLIVHDFASNLSWPQKDRYDRDSPTQERPYVDPDWLHAVERLQQAHPDRILRPELVD